MQGNSAVAVEHLEIELPGGRVLEDLNFEVPTLGSLAVLGRSGQGKTTLLRAIAGLLHTRKAPRITGGQVRFFGEMVDRKAGPEERPVSMLFQKPVLFPHLTIKRNAMIAAGTGDRIDAEDRVLRLAQRLFIDNRLLERRVADHLSGGEEERAGLLRAFASRRDILLLDEPLKASLNLDLRWQLMHAIRELSLEQKRTTIIVTHNFLESSYLADQIAVLTANTIICGRPQDLYTSPPNLEAAKLLGPGTEVPINWLRRRDVRESLFPVDISGSLPKNGSESDRAFFRPQHVRPTNGVTFEIIEDRFVGIIDFSA